MLKVTRKDKITNERLREMSKVKDAVVEAAKNKHRWAGHVIRRDDGRWTRNVTYWYPYEVKRPLGRPPTRWSDAIKKKFGREWIRIARDRQKWKQCCDLHRSPPPGMIDYRSIK
uniref:Uncharacterized protein n=1 Tax=Plectus sambesii TaxID=2011161 RepID=A0A914WNX7_9BILA